MRVTPSSTPWFYFLFPSRLGIITLSSKAQDFLNCHLWNSWLVYKFLLFKDNSLKEWSYKKAVTIQTYESYNPIHAPLNIVSELFLLHWWNEKKKRRQSRPRRGSRQPHSARVKLVTIASSVVSSFTLLKMLYIRHFRYRLILTQTSV